MCSSGTLSSLGLPSSMVAANSFSVSCWINVVLSPFAVLMAFRKVTVNRLTTQPCTQIYPQPSLVRHPDSLSDKAEPQAQLEGTPWHRVYARLQFNRWSQLALAHAPMVNKGVSTFTLYTHSLVVSSKTSSFDKEQVSTVKIPKPEHFLEPQAAIRAIETAKANSIQKLQIQTDSKFLIDGITKWIKGPSILLTSFSFRAKKLMQEDDSWIGISQVVGLICIDLRLGSLRRPS